MTISEDLTIGTHDLGSIPGSQAISAYLVDAFSSFVINQTLPGVQITLDPPTDPKPGKIMKVISAATATVDILVNGQTLSPGRHLEFLWDGGAWAIHQASTPVPGWIGAPWIVMASHTSLAHTYQAGSVSLSSMNAIRVRILDLPSALMTDASLQAQVELLRAVGRRTRRRTAGGYIHSRGWSHPAHYVGGVAGPRNFGTRDGRPHDYVEYPGNFVTVPERRTEFSIFGLTYGSSIDLPVAEIFGNYFTYAEVNDVNGGAVRAVCYQNGGGYNNRRRPRKPHRAGWATNRGRFALRYSWIDAATGRRVVGPVSEQFEVGIGCALWIDAANVGGQLGTIIVNPAADVPSGNPMAAKLIARHAPIR